MSSRPGSASIYIPVNALQNLRASMPALATSASVTSLPSVSRSTASLSIAAGKSPGQSFLSSVISSKPFAGLTSGLAPPSSFPVPGTSPNKIITKKLWPGGATAGGNNSRSKSLGRSAWQPHIGYRWTHFTNRQVTLESTHLLLLHDFERIALQKVAAQKLNSSDLGSTIRIPKDPSDKPKRRGHYFKKVLPRAGKDKTREGMSGGGPVFGVPLHQCVDASSWRRRPGVVPTGLESASQPQTHLDEANTQHKADLLGRISSGSIFDSRSMERIHPSNLATLTSATSLESLSLLDLHRRASLSRSSQCSGATMDALTSAQSQLTLHHPTHHHPHLESGDDTFGVGIPTSPTHSASGPCVPTVVMMCIRHLEIHGLHTVGIFRVSSSKRRVKQNSTVNKIG